MKKLKDIIQEVLVHKHANKDTIKDDNFIDLDLPSGTLWATKNLGASKPEEPGDFYAWGELTPNKNIFNWESYRFLNYKTSLITKYSNKKDKKTILDLKDDIAYKKDKNIQIPSIKQFNELIENTNIEYTGTEVKFISKKSNNHYIILPCPGLKLLDMYEGKDMVGYYWTNERLSTRATAGNVLCIRLNGNKTSIEDVFRYKGCQIRPVKKK